MPIHTQKQHFTIGSLHRKYARFVNETKAFNSCASKQLIFLLQQIFTASLSLFVFDQRGDFRAGAFDQYVKNASHDMKMMTSVMVGF